MDIDSMISVLQAYKEGKAIEFYASTKEWLKCVNPVWDFENTKYRIKPEPRYRPFKNAEEVMEAIKEHGDWVLQVGYEQYDRITCCHSIGVRTGDIGCISYDEAFTELSFLDGTPFGKLEE